MNSNFTKKCRPCEGFNETSHGQFIVYHLNDVAGEVSQAVETIEGTKGSTEDLSSGKSNEYISKHVTSDNKYRAGNSTNRQTFSTGELCLLNRSVDSVERELVKMQSMFMRSVLVDEYNNTKSNNIVVSNLFGDVEYSEPFNNELPGNSHVKEKSKANYRNVSFEKKRNTKYARIDSNKKYKDKADILFQRPQNNTFSGIGRQNKTFSAGSCSSSFRHFHLKNLRTYFPSECNSRCNCKSVPTILDCEFPVRNDSLRYFRPKSVFSNETCANHIAANLKETCANHIAANNSKNIVDASNQINITSFSNTVLCNNLPVFETKSTNTPAKINKFTQTGHNITKNVSTDCIFITNKNANVNFYSSDIPNITNYTYSSTKSPPHNCTANNFDIISYVPTLYDCARYESTSCDTIGYKAISYAPVTYCPETHDAGGI